MKKNLLFLALIITGLSSSTSVFAQVTANQPSSIIICDEVPNDGFAEFDLTLLDAEIINGQPNTFVEYYLTLASAEAGIDPIQNPTSYTNTIPDFQIIFARLEDSTNGDYDTTSFSIQVEESPIIIAPTPLETCDYTEITGSNDELEPFDLEVKTVEITGGDVNIYITYHETQELADSGNNPLTSPYINIVNPQTIYIRAENVTTNCIVSQGYTLDLIVHPLPSPITPYPLVVCDENNDGFGEFVLTDMDDEITGGDPDLEVSYHITLQDAESGVYWLSSPYLNVNPFAQIIYARVENLDSGCFAIILVELIVELSPEVINISDLVAVDDDGNGFAFFDLTSKIPEILNGQTDINITFYVTQADAETGVNAIANPTAFPNTSNPQTIYSRLENFESCFAISNFDLVAVDAIIDTEPDDLYINEGDDDGFAIFDLTINEAQMLGDQDPLIALFTYHITLEDATNGENSIATPNAYQNTINPQTIFVRLTNSNTGYYVLTDFEIETDGALGISDNFYTNLKLYPNPTSGIINIQSDQLTETVAVKLYNLQGQVLVFEQKSPINGTISLDLSNMNTGIYFIKIVLEDVSVIKRIVKQ